MLNVQIKGFKVSVMGEVKRSVYRNYIRRSCASQKALTMAGDLTPSGKRDNILVIREDGDQRKTYTVDLTSGEKVLESPCYC